VSYPSGIFLAYPICLERGRSYTVKKIMTVSSICLLIGFLVLAGCQASSNTDKNVESNPPPAPPAPWTPVASLEEIKYDTSTPDNIILEGRRTFQSSCSACHDLPTTQRIKEFSNEDELLEFMIAMSEETGLPVEHSEKVIRYMLALFHNNVP
jgi:hypothetical protein